MYRHRSQNIKDDALSICYSTTGHYVGLDYTWKCYGILGMTSCVLNVEDVEHVEVGQSWELRKFFDLHDCLPCLHRSRMNYFKVMYLVVVEDI